MTCDKEGGLGKVDQPPPIFIDITSALVKGVVLAGNSICPVLRGCSSWAGFGKSCGLAWVQLSSLDRVDSQHMLCWLVDALAICMCSA